MFGSPEQAGLSRSAPCTPEKHMIHGMVKLNLQTNCELWQNEFDPHDIPPFCFNLSLLVVG